MSRDSTLARNAQRERLALACHLDRLKLRLAARPSPLEKLTFSVLENLAPLAPHLPGRLGKWTRGIMRGTQFFKSVFEAASR
jgi:hypothetical protein